MKTLIFVSLITLFTTAQGAVVCKKSGRYWYPENATAKTIAKSLGVKTCSGKRFKAVVSKLGETSNVPATVKKMSVDELVAHLKKK